MGLTLTSATLSALGSVVKTPNLVLEIDGVTTKYGLLPVQEPVRIGDGSIIGDPETEALAFYVGGLRDIADQDNVLTFSGTSTSIKQTLDQFKGQGSSVTTLSLSLMDDGAITQLITPGEVIDDIMQAQAIVRFGFQGTAYPSDYPIVFRGFVTDINSSPGSVVLQLNGTDEKKRTNLFKQAEAKTLQSVSATSTQPIALDSYDNFLTRILSADGSIDSSFQSYVRIDDEVIQYQTIDVATGLTGITRGALQTKVVQHDVGATVNSFYRLTGNGVDLALKLMASGINDGQTAGASITGEAVTSINIGGPDFYQNGIYFEGQDVVESFGVTIGDFVSLSGGSNTFVNRKVTDVIQGQSGGFIVVAGANLTTDSATTIKMAITSQWNTLPDGCQMSPDEIDIDEHLRIKRLFLSSATYDFYLKDTVDSAKDFIETQIYLPLSAYSLPRKARASIGYQIGPIPGQTVVEFDETNIKAPKTLRVQRSTNTGFFNEVIYKFDQDVVSDDYKSGYITISELSKTRIKNSPNRSLVVESLGLRTSLDALAIIKDKSQRRLDRYQYGAEQFTFSSLLDDGFAVEIGDIVSFDGSALFLPDIKTGERGIAPRLLEITNKDVQLKTGDLKFTAVDTNFDGTARYGLISPSSVITSVNSATSFSVGASFSKRFGSAEYKKWSGRDGDGIRVRSADFTIMGEARLMTVAIGNAVTLATALPFVPQVGMIMELVKYTSTLNTDNAKRSYGWMSADEFPDGQPPYRML